METRGNGAVRGTSAHVSASDSNPAEAVIPGGERTLDTGQDTQLVRARLSAAAAAAIAGVHERTIRRAIKRGELTALKQRGVFRIELAALEAWRASQTAGTTLPPSITPPAIDVAPELSVPRPLTRLIGREAELCRLHEMIRERHVRLLTLAGPGGSGKTRMAVELASMLTPSFPDGVWFISLESISDPDQVSAVIAKSVGYAETVGRSHLEFLVSTLAGTASLLVLDSFEHVINAAGDISRLLKSCPGLSVVVTSRTLLRVDGEHAFPVLPLSVPPRTPDLVIDDIEAYPAIALFLERARAVRPTFRLTSANAAIVVDVCRILDGLPLAIELAAARLNALSVVALRERLGHRLDLLRGELRDTPKRHRTMRDTIAWSYDHLGTNERVLIRRLAVFVGGFSLDAVEALVAGLEPADGVEYESFGIDLVGSLVDKSLIQLAERNDRYTMLGTIRAYVLERLDGSTDEADARSRHAEWCIQFCESLPGGWNAASESLEWLYAAEDEYDNIIAALEWFEHCGDGESLLRLAIAIRWVWEVRGFPSEAVDWFERGLAISERANRLTVLKAHAVLGRTLKRRGYFDIAAPHLQEALDLAIVLKDPRLIAQRIYALGGLKTNLEEFAEARRYLDDALSMFDQLGDASGVCGAHYFLGIVSLGEDDIACAKRHFEAALAARAASTATFNLSVLLNALALVECELGAFVSAQRHLAESFAEWNAGRGANPDVLAEWLAVNARLVGLLRDPERAVVLFGASHGLSRAIGLPLLMPGPARHDHYVRWLRTMLGDDRFDDAWQAGLTLPPEGAIEMSSSIEVPNRATSRQHLTAREREILTMVAAGLRDKDIADALFISARTVQGHVAHILDKLDVPTRSAAIRLALSRGLIDGEDMVDKSRS